MNKLCKEYEIHERETTTREAWKRMSKQLRREKRTGKNEIQIIFHFMGEYQYEGIWIYDYREKNGEKKLTLVGNFRGWKK